MEAAARRERSLELEVEERSDGPKKSGVVTGTEEIVPAGSMNWREAMVVENPW